MSGNYIKYWKSIAMIFAISAILASCRDDDMFSDNLKGDPEETVRISASVNPADNTRANVYIEEGDVNRGTFLLHYRTTNSTSSSYFGVSYVDFGNAEGPNVGYAYRLVNGEKKDLKWKHIYGNGAANQTFYLSNVDPATYSESNSSTYKKLRFNQTVNGVSNNPYVASPLDEEFGTNDLLMADASAKNTTGKINFTLEHILSLLKINVEVFSAKSDNWAVDLSNARIFITNLCTVTGSAEFYMTSSSDYRHRFTYSTTTNPSYYQPYGGTYYNPADVSLTDPAISRGWGKVQEPVILDDYEQPYSKIVYESKRFIFPPQTIPPLDGSGNLPAASSGYTGSPVLTVRVPRADATGIAGEPGDSIDFVGKVPDIMFNTDADGNIIATSPQAIALKTGTQLTITAQINSPETSLTFAPAKIEAWVSKNSFYIKTTQGGIYKASDFYALIDAYNRGDEEEMIRYGYHDPDGNFVFQLWASTKVEEDLIRGSMVPGVNPDGTVRPNYSFVFNSYSLTLQENNETIDVLTDVEGQYDLYNILTGEDKHFTGINTDEEMLSVIRQITNPKAAVFGDLIKFGWFNNSDNTLNFYVKNTVNFCIDELFGKMLSYRLWNYDIIFNIEEGESIRITMPEAPQVYYEVKPEDEFDVMQRLAVKPSQAGIKSVDDHYFLIEAYNKFYKYFPNILSLYGSLGSNSDKWSLQYLSNMSIDGTKAFVSMEPDPENGKPNYSVGGSNYTIVITHPYVPCSITSFYMYQPLSGNGCSSEGRYFRDSTQPGYIMPAYNNNSYDVLWDFGKFDSVSKKWIFRMSYNSTNARQYADYSAIFGQMIPDEEHGKFDYEFDLWEPFEVKKPVYPDDWEGEKPSSLFFYQNGGNENYDYPNTAADLKLMALGKYWERYTEWKNQRSVKARNNQSKRIK